MEHLRIVFFGTPQFSVTILEHMKEAGLTPALVVSAPDKKVGRKHILTPPPVAVWAREHNIPLLQPEKPEEIIQHLREHEYDLFVVAAYGYILSQELITLPKYKTLNVHTSLLPRYRGASPIESAILNGDTETGSSIMLMDNKMDHGPILSQERIPLSEETNRVELFDILSHHGAQLLVKTIRRWVQGTITPQEQNHKEASSCSKIKKSYGDITNDDDKLRYRKYLAYMGWPGVFFIDEYGKRVKVTKARYEDSSFIIESVIPEGKNEQPYKRR